NVIGSGRGGRERNRCEGREKNPLQETHGVLPFLANRLMERRYERQKAVCPADPERPWPPVSGELRGHRGLALPGRLGPQVSRFVRALAKTANPPATAEKAARAPLAWPTPARCAVAPRRKGLIPRPGEEPAARTHPAFPTLGSPS